MTKLYEIRDRIVRFCSRYEVYLEYLLRFVVALILFSLINTKLGFMVPLARPYVTFGLSVLGCVLPIGMTLFLAALLTIAHLYVLSAEVALMAVLVFALVFLMYFRFAPQDVMLLAITPIFHTMGIPYVLPIGTGLLKQGYSVVSVICGTVVYYFLEGIYKNIKVLQATVAGADVEGAKMSITAGVLLDNKELFFTLIVFTISTLVVYTIRSMSIQHAWKVAILAGILIQTTGLLIGYIWFNITEKVMGMLLGNIFAALVAFVMELLFRNLDYSRTERVQFEDDEYYYYVKAVPKKMVASSEKTITEFGGFSGFTRMRKTKKETSEKITRKNIADELEIDEDLLK